MYKRSDRNSIDVDEQTANRMQLFVDSQKVKALKKKIEKKVQSFLWNQLPEKCGASLEYEALKMKWF